MDDDQEIEQEEELYTRGRSRSRSMHANDETGLDASSSIDITANKIHAEQQRTEKLVVAERTGPLQQKEIVALKKVCLI